MSSQCCDTGEVETKEAGVVGVQWEGGGGNVFLIIKHKFSIYVLVGLLTNL